MASYKKAMKVITIKEPWASAIFQSGKNVENRTWRTHYRGPLIIHAGKGKFLDFDPYQWARKRGLCLSEKNEKKGNLIGIVDLVDCVKSYKSPWSIDGHWHWILNKARTIRHPISVPGQVGLWNAPASELALLTDSI